MSFDGLLRAPNTDRICGVIIVLHEHVVPTFGFLHFYAVELRGLLELVVGHWRAHDPGPLPCAWLSTGGAGGGAPCVVDCNFTAHSDTTAIIAMALSGVRLTLSCLPLAKVKLKSNTGIWACAFSPVSGCW